MSNFFLNLVNISITASWIVLVVVLMRLILKKAPKWINCLLWAIVGLRLIMPFSLESVFSLIPSTETIGVSTQTGIPNVQTGLPMVDNTVNEYIGEYYYTEAPAVAEKSFDFLGALTIVWLVGILAMLIYSVFSYLKISKSVKASVLNKDNIYFCDNIQTPFILGIIKLRIYLPSGISAEQSEYVIRHENAHIKRKDHWWKPLGFALLTVYWFNPAMWLAYVLLCRDIELACDEKAIKDMDNDDKKGYSEALLSNSLQRRMIMACPLAFGEVGVKDRIKSVLNYKKPAFWIIAVAIVAVAVISVCFLTNPDKDNKESTTTTTESTTVGEESITDEPSTTETTTEESTTEKETTTKKETTTVKKSSLKPLSKAKINEIKKAYINYMGYPIAASRRLATGDVMIAEYYGTYDDCIAIFITDRYSWYNDEPETQKIAGYEFSYPDSRTIKIYRDGEFRTLQWAYNQGWVSKKAVKSIHHYYTTEDESVVIDTTYAISEITPLSDLSVAITKQKYLDYYGFTNKSVSDVTISEYFGTYGADEEYMAMFIDGKDFGTGGIADVVTKTKIAGYTFVYPTSKTIDIYYFNEFTTLEKAYEKGWLTDYDIRDIYYYYTNANTRKSVDNSYVPPAFIPLTDEKSLKIKQDYLAFHKDAVERHENWEIEYYNELTPERQKEYLKLYGTPEYRKMTTDDITIREYFGTYNDCAIMFIDNPMWCYTCEFWSEEIAGYTFGYGSSQTLDVYRNGEFVSLKEAYEKGWLSKKDIKDIRYYYAIL